MLIGCGCMSQPDSYFVKDKIILLHIKNHSCLIGLLLLYCSMSKKRELYFFKNYFEDFYKAQTDKVKKKILWTLKVIEEIDRIPDVYLKHLKNTVDFTKLEFKSGITFSGFSPSSTLKILSL